KQVMKTVEAALSKKKTVEAEMYLWPPVLLFSAIMEELWVWRAIKLLSPA
ncbi:hypothetical protein E2562_000522, partial [Oryza meyeriana var. granulata]